MVPRPQTVLLFAISFAACAATPVRPGETGLRGLVLRGPVAPGPEVEGRANEEPFRALFHVYEGGDVEVARFESGDDGRFEVALAPGVMRWFPMSRLRSSEPHASGARWPSPITVSTKSPFGSIPDCDETAAKSFVAQKRSLIRAAETPHAGTRLSGVVAVGSATSGPEGPSVFHPHGCRLCISKMRSRRETSLGGEFFFAGSRRRRRGRCSVHDEGAAGVRCTC